MNKSAKVALVLFCCALVGFLIHSGFRTDASVLVSAVNEKRNAKDGMERDVPLPDQPRVKSQIVAAVTAGVSRGEISTQSIMEKRRLAANALKAGQPAKALSELLSCLTDSFAKGVHQGIKQIVLADLVRLGETYAPAQEVIIDYRDAARELMMEKPENVDYAVAFSVINKLLGDEELTVQMMDTLPDGDRRKDILAVNAPDALIEKRRYAETAKAKGLTTMLQAFEQVTNYPQEKTSEAYRLKAVTDAAKDIEILAGSNKLNEAQVLIDRVLLYDGSDQAKRIIKERVVKSGMSLDLFSNL